MRCCVRSRQIVRLCPFIRLCPFVPCPIGRVRLRCFHSPAFVCIRSFVPCPFACDRRLTVLPSIVPPCKRNVNNQEYPINIQKMR